MDTAETTWLLVIFTLLTSSMTRQFRLNGGGCEHQSRSYRLLSALTAFVKPRHARNGKELPYGAPTTNAHVRQDHEEPRRGRMAARDGPVRRETASDCGGSRSTGSPESCAAAPTSPTRDRNLQDHQRGSNAANVRRVEAITGQPAIEWFRERPEAACSVSPTGCSRSSIEP